MKRNCSFQAVIFDLDGVITKTAVIHAQAWKLVFDEYLRRREKRDGEVFRPFTHKADYLPYVDGKPRYEGVRSFLQSRKIKIPFGSPEDKPAQETICGIGNKKNQMFRYLLTKKKPQVFSSTIQLIRALKKSGVRIGVASSSANCQQILQSAGIENLFQTRVDGVVSSELALKGKPEGDIFVTAAHNLGARVGSCVVAEDASSGVAAGRNGEFGLVLGVARGDNQGELLENGADVVVRDLGEITIAWMEEWFQRKPKPLFGNWDKIEKTKGGKIMLNPHYSRTAEAALLSGKRPVVFLDYDGTLAPIVQRPQLAVLSEDMRTVLKTLAQKYTVAIISGRARAELQRLVGIKGLIYAGSHGMDIAGPEFSMVHPKAEELAPVIRQINTQLREDLKDIPQILIEEKKFSISVHYRLVAEKHLLRIKQKVDDIIQRHNPVYLMGGKKVWEILPRIDWDKGRAVRWIVQALKVSWKESSIVYIGDDTTDEDAFRMVCTRGTAILVSYKAKQSAADFRLSSVAEVKELFAVLLRKGKSNVK